MSQTLSLYSSQRIAPPDFVRFVHDVGGQILDEATLDASVSRDDCHVWFYGARDRLAGRAEEPEPSIERKLGASALVHLDMQLSHADGSEMLALEVAHAFAQRWVAVASCAATVVLSSAELGGLAKIVGEPPALCGSDVQILFLSEPNLAGVIADLDGLSLEGADTAEMASAMTEFHRLNGADLDPEHERLLGFLSGKEGDMWLVRNDNPWKHEVHACGLGTIVQRKLGRPPSCEVRLVVGYGASPSVDEQVLAIVTRLLGSQPGVMVGGFFAILDAHQIADMNDHGLGLLVC